MKILLINGDEDGKDRQFHRGKKVKPFPNLALMKISALHKKLGDTVYFSSCQSPDLVCISCVFSWNKNRLMSIASFYPNSKILYGGSGYSLDSQLNDEIEHQMPDYSLYNIDYSIGFTSRGCIRKCPWCIVPTKEGWIKENAPITEFLYPDHRKLLLLDNNILASPLCDEKLRWLGKWGGKVSLNQGNDIRLVNKKNAELFSQMENWDGDFNERRLYFSFDLPQIELEVRKGIETLESSGIPTRQLMFYILCGYNSSHEDDLSRVKLIRSYGADAYVMIYNKHKNDRWLSHLKRWNNQHIKGSFEDYKFSDSQKWIRKLSK